MRSVYRAVSKYRNRKVEVDGMVFDSQKEYRRWRELQFLEKAGEIYQLQRQVTFVLIPIQKDEITGKVIEREAKYIADFSYRRMSDQRLVVEDVKSEATKTDLYRLKKKLLLYRYGIIIQEV